MTCLILDATAVYIKKSSSFMSMQSMPSEVDGAIVQSVVSVDGITTEGNTGRYLCKISFLS